MNDYESFIESKHQRFSGCGIDVIPRNDNPFGWQRDVTAWALRKGRAAIFADCGLGKTLMQLCWAEEVSRFTRCPVLILTPISVAEQTAREAVKFSIETRVRIVAKQADVLNDGSPEICLTNYEKLHLFNPNVFTGVALDESSILKNYTGKTKRQLVEAFAQTPYRLACTATPSPNDLMELGNHSEFLGVLPSDEMISRFFVNDSMKAGRYVLRRHGAGKFWDWLASWAVCLTTPADLGYPADDYRLPGLEINQHVLESDAAPEGMLFDTLKPNAVNLNKIRRSTLGQRAAKVSQIVNDSPEQFVVWCKLNDEADAIRRLIPDSVEVRGTHTGEERSRRFFDFIEGRSRVLITKPELGGWGLNFQHCHRMTWFPSFSFEEFYQCVRRLYRFGQTRKVIVDEILTDADLTVQKASLQKQVQHALMNSEMAERMAEISKRELAGHTLKPASYNPTKKLRLPEWLQPKPY